MLTLSLRRRFPLALTGLLAACGQPLDGADDSKPQNEALPGAPEGIIYVGEGEALPPGFVIQSLSSADQTTMLSTVNATRTKGTRCGTTSYAAAPALVINTKLVTAAEGHAADMAAKNYFSHTGLDGRDPGQRITAAGYKWSTYGENIAAGRTAIADTVKDWYGSTGHCMNFMNKSFTQAGFGKGYNAAATYKTYWVAVMARPL